MARIGSTFFYGHMIPHGMGTPHFVSLSLIYGHLGCGAMSIHVRDLAQTYVLSSLGYIHLAVELLDGLD